MKFFLFLVLLVFALFLGSSITGLLLIGVMSWFSAEALMTKKLFSGMSASKF